MSQNQTPSALPSLITFLMGAAIGAVVVALTTRKAGPRPRKDLKDLANRGRGRGHRAAEGLRGHGPRPRRTIAWQTPGTKGDHPVSVNDLPG